MKQTVDAPSGLRWKVKRLIVPTGMRPLSRTDMLDVASPRRTVVDGMSRQVPDAFGSWTGPLPLGFLLGAVGAAAIAFRPAPASYAVVAVDDRGACASLGAPISADRADLRRPSS